MHINYESARAKIPHLLPALGEGEREREGPEGLGEPQLSVRSSQQLHLSLSLSLFDAIL